VPEPAPRAKPEWWTEAWERLTGVKLSVLGYVEPVCPEEFKDEVRSDIYAFDQPGYESQTGSTTGETIEAGEGNELLRGVISVVWNDRHVTMTRCADKNTSPALIYLRNCANVVSLCPEGAALTFQAYSWWLVSEWDERESGYEGRPMHAKASPDFSQCQEFVILRN
jgi:hypothetical protein